MPIQIGRYPDELTVVLNPASPLTCVMARTDKTTGAPVAWTVPPTLTFSDASTWVADLATNQATFTATAVEVDRVLALPDPAVTLSLAGITWAKGCVTS